MSDDMSIEGLEAALHEIVGVENTALARNRYDRKRQTMSPYDIVIDGTSAAILAKIELKRLQEDGGFQNPPPRNSSKIEEHGIDVKGYDKILISDVLKNSALAMRDEQGMSLQDIRNAAIVGTESRELEIRATSAAMIVVCEHLIDEERRLNDTQGNA